MTEVTDVVKPYASAHGLARAAAILLGVFAFTSIPLVGLSLSNIRMFQVLQSASASLAGVEPGEPALDMAFVLSKGAQIVLAVGDQFSGPVMVIGLVAGLVCLVWIYRVHSNLAALGARNLTFTTEWAVGWWFIPIIHLFRPYQVVSEIWRGSDPGGSDEMMPELASPSTLLGWWWALVVSAVLFQFYYPFWAEVTGGRLFGTRAAVDPEFYLVEATSAALNIAAAVLGIVLILSIDRMQTAKHRRVTAGGAPPESVQAPADD